MSTVLSFAEESCWDGELFRSVRRPVVFILTATIPKHGPIQHEFTADFGVFYDVDDDWLINILCDEIPAVEWGWFVYFKKLDHSAIQLLSPETDRVLGEIFPRGSRQPAISADRLPEGVSSMDKWRKSLEKCPDPEGC